MARNGNAGAFETIVDRYQGRLLGFCRQMLGSTEDAEDVLQEVFVNAYRAMLADEREINLRPWLYRIARNRSLNYLRKPTADAQESMDMVPAAEASSTAEKVHNREEFRQLLVDVGKLPETQRSALLLREMDALSYEEIAQAMDTSVPSVKSLLVRARISLAEASQARLLTCGEVRLELAEAAEGLRKVSGPVRRHLRECEECSAFRSQVRSDEKILAALSPIGPLLALKGFIASKLGFGGAGAGTGASAAGASAAGAGAGAGATGAGAVGSSVGAALGGSSAASGIGAIGGAIGTKAVAGVVTAAVITAGAVEMKPQESPVPFHRAPIARISFKSPSPAIAPAHVIKASPPVAQTPAPVVPAPTPPVKAPVANPPSTPPPASTDATAQSNETTTPTKETKEGVTTASPTSTSPPATHTGDSTVVVTVGESSAPPPPPAAEPPPEQAPEPSPTATPPTSPPTEETPATP